MRAHGWHYNVENNDGNVGNFNSHPWVDVYLTQAHGNTGYLGFIDGSTYDVSNSGPIRNERWLYVFGCLFASYSENGGISSGPLVPWSNIFNGSTLHGIYGYNQDISFNGSDPTGVYNWWYNWFHEIGDQSTLGQLNSPAAYNAFVKASQDNQDFDWAVIDRTTTHGDRLSAAPNPSVYPNDTDGNLQYWTGNGTSGTTGPLQPGDIIRKTQSLTTGTPVVTYRLQPESYTADQLVARYPAAAPYRQTTGTVTTFDSPYGFAEMHSVTGGSSVSHFPSGRTFTGTQDTAYQTALAWVQDNGGLPGDAVLQPALVQSQTGESPTSPARVLGYTFIWKHSGPFQGGDSITVSIDQELVKVPNPNYTGDCGPARLAQAKAAVVTTGCPPPFVMQQQPGVWYYYRTWRTPVAVSGGTTRIPLGVTRSGRLARRPSTPATFQFTLTPEMVISRLRTRSLFNARTLTTASVTSQGFAYWTPPFNDDNPNDAYTVPAQYFDVNNHVRTYFDLSGNPLGTYAI